MKDNNMDYFDLEHMFDKLIDNDYGYVDIAGKTYKSSTALRKIDNERYLSSLVKFIADYKNENP